MKLNAGKRVLMFFHWLFSLLICAAFAGWLFKPELVKDLYGRVTAGLSATHIMIIGIAVLAIYTILVVVQVWIIFYRGRRADRGFITVDSSDTGRVRIAISAIEHMVRQSVNAIDGISDMKIGIENMDDAIGINIAAIIQNGSHVPTITMNMQRAIRQFVEMNCGVAVRAVSISINGVTDGGDSGKRRRRQRGAAVAPAPVEAPVQTPAPEAPAAPAAEAPSPASAFASMRDFSEPEPERKIELRLDPVPAYVNDAVEDAPAAANVGSAAEDDGVDDAGEDDYRSWPYPDDADGADEDETPRFDADVE